MVDQGILSPDSERYLRAILLLHEGGSYITKRVIESEAAKSTDSLDTILLSRRKKLEHAFFSKQIAILFPPGGSTDLDRWDLQMLTGVIPIVFRNSTTLDSEAKDNVKTLKRLRNELIAHHAKTSLDEEDYEDIMEELKRTIMILSAKLGSIIGNHCSKLIHKYRTYPVVPSIDTYKNLTANDGELLKAIDAAVTGIAELDFKMNTVIQQQREGFQKILNRMVQMEKSMMSQNKTVPCNAELSFDDPDNEWLSDMEKSLTDIVNEANTSGASQEDMREIREYVKKLLDKLNSLKDVKFKGAKQKCVLLMFECSTYNGLIELLVFLNSEKYLGLLASIANSLRSYFRLERELSISSRVPDDCLEDITLELEKSCKTHGVGEEKVVELKTENRDETNAPKGGIKLLLECGSVEAVRQVWNMFEEGGAAEELKNLENALTIHYGRRVELKTSIDYEELSRAIDEYDKSNEFLKQNDQYKIETSSESTPKEFQNVKVSDHIESDNKQMPTPEENVDEDKLHTGSDVICDSDKQRDVMLASDECDLDSKRIKDFTKPISVYSKQDQAPVVITDLSVVGGHFCAVIDVSNKTVKVVDTKSASVSSVINLDLSEADKIGSIASVRDEKLAVSLLVNRKKQIQFFSVSEGGEIKRLDQCINVPNVYYAMVHKDDRFYSCTGKSVEILGMDGKVISTIKIPENRYSHGLGVSNDCKTIYVSASTENEVLGIDLDGKIKYSYTDNDLQLPWGITVDAKGEVYVASFDKKCVHQLTADLTKMQVIKLDFPSQKITCSHAENTLLVANRSGSEINIY